jgi:LysM repeat protein
MAFLWTKRNGGQEGGNLSTPPSACQNTTVPKNGKRLKVLSALALATVLYTVKPGDTLSGAAQQYNTTWEAIYHDNQSEIRNPNLIYVGEKLRIPEGDRTTGTVPVQASTPRSFSSTNTVQSTPVQSAPAQSYNVTPVQSASTPTQSTSSAASSSTSSAASSTSSSTSASSLADIPGVPEAFAACVAYRESTDDTNPAADGNAYGIIPASGYNVAGDSIAQQKQVFVEIYDTTGPSAWAADGCAS